MNSPVIYRRTDDLLIPEPSSLTLMPHHGNIGHSSLRGALEKTCSIREAL
jgi:hypothetical protein